MPEDKKTTQTKEKVQKSKEQVKKVNIADLKPGMTVKIYQKIKELNAKGEEKERVQFFEGIVIAKKHGLEKGGTVTIRKVSDGVGVEKIFPINLPTIQKVEIKKQARVRRAKLYFLKGDYKKRLKETIIK
ncbi:50S ribosomal protein L19 [Candidatus Falkowbacteria bacterium RIFOXYB2_FULL_34_18]|uniref:50S ribosomal protein L19 n=1 Tax=Candidatus Falkowbacteria bacterium RIFOXYD2_FULL_34_120 TaxID=1798007 RepID=A0A1F5TP64_9BACT|nr:MAG: 50S ribosomal protein L19 [Candidatus Falkowbacteria bacterium RIFOXYB2_FULL_34_18]OGF29092.1 MAG: 50S ribosomal protein L19 [Candidatus Falkowbacteria bacterium RIFOXYC12_FULL_34_55]OGF36175.1 MAG: 50S ribosomal protein L19 [Candidatus Falkowbacteria bacterium RIFOXYC2_FULL_34_220]OGF38602.1 MAG: 50S ribosomal protein L19 [Candidatus Falkowbacteria bacterium RIFOXYD12_FULL_34_57]OGF40785.1 MAG: 50S ribosomal protein L19 [Candidatus Falkowbacteria bacterium RIFOXYD2_FULL_34_120]